VPVAVPVPGKACDHDDGNPPPTAPGYQSSVPTPTPNWNTGYGRSGDQGGFAWGPALGGFLVGSMFGGNGGGHHHHHRHGHRHGGGWGGNHHGGGGGGFTISGDSGGGGGGGFNIRGDS
jgi:hypothetical protein